MAQQTEQELLEEFAQWKIAKAKAAAAASKAAPTFDLDSITVENMSDPAKAKQAASAIMTALRGDPDYRTT